MGQRINGSTDQRINGSMDGSMDGWMDSVEQGGVVTWQERRGDGRGMGAWGTALERWDVKE